MSKPREQLVSCPSTMRDLLQHVGHKLSCVYYGENKKNAVDVAIECETCGVVLLDIERQ